MLTDDPILIKQEECLDKLSQHELEYDLAENNYESTLAKCMIKAKEEHGATMSKDLARGDAELILVKKTLQEAKRNLMACKRQVDWLQNVYEHDKLKTRLQGKIT